MITKAAVDLFDQWALSGKDKGMEEGHSISVKRMIEIAINKLSKTNNQFSILDIGCGNGWMLRNILSQFPNSDGLGVDGSINMIKNANKIDSKGNYLYADLNTWRMTQKFNLIVSMEVIYYLDNPKTFIKSLFNHSLSVPGHIIIGIDHYIENKQSLSWPEDLNVHMNTLSINQWINIFNEIGYKDVSYEQFNKKEDWAGTLIISAAKY